MRIIKKSGIILLSMCFCLPIFATTIWQDKNNYTASEQFAVGDIIVINVQDISVIQFELSSQNNDSVSIESNPDVTITGFLPKASSSRKIKGDDKGKFAAKSKIGFFIATQVQNIQNGKLTVSGTRTYVLNGVANSIAVSGVVDQALLTGRDVDSSDVANFQMQVNSRRQLMNLQFQPLQPDSPASAELTEQQKQQLIIEYLQKIISEQERP
ncbi:MAG: flagellar basal body L-ring protein FlgH [Leptospirales bacterium]|nr:flagellar basal body L-ring protein FlgH [Leptospirales bacterium]